jgi:phosphoesterase RecJ-like protein
MNWVWAKRMKTRYNERAVFVRPASPAARVTDPDAPPPSAIGKRGIGRDDRGSAQGFANGHTPDAETWESAVELINDSSEILLICHVAPDGDAIGSLLGLGLALQTLGKRSTLACESPAPAKFNFLPGFAAIVNVVRSTSFDLVVGLDSSDPSRLGEVYDADGLSGTPLINIDHHVTNLYFGDVNVVDPSAASTAEIVLLLLDHLDLRLDAGQDKESGAPLPALARDAWTAQRREEIATCLLTGVVTDTQGFRTSNVTPQVMVAAMRLMQAGASLSQVTELSFNRRPLGELKLLARGLGRFEAEDGLAWSEIYLSDRPERDDGEMDDGDAGLVGMLARTKEVHLAAVFVEKQNDQVDISLRADPGFDVARLALSLGGGGHPAAAGCTIEGSVEAAKRRVLPMLRAALEEQSNHRKA